MRPKINTQDEFDFQPSNLKLTHDYYAKYQAIAAILDENPEIMDTIHRDLASALEEIVAQDKRGAQYKFTSDIHVLGDPEDFERHGLLRPLNRSRRVRASQGTSDLTAWDAWIHYLEPRLAMTDYVDYRLAGFDIGSGKMEATGEQLVSVRLKGSGRPWGEGGAVAMVALNAHRINDPWDEFRATRPLQRAAECPDL